MSLIKKRDFIEVNIIKKILSKYYKKNIYKNWQFRTLKSCRVCDALVPATQYTQCHDSRRMQRIISTSNSSLINAKRVAID